MNIPPPLPENGPLQLQELQRAFNELRRYCESLTPRNSPTVRANHTSIGTSYDAAPQTSNGPAGTSLPTWLP